MAERFVAPLAELMAVAGLDTRNFDEALLNTQVKMDNFADRVLTTQQALKELGEVGALAGRQYQDFGIAIQLVSEQMAKNADAARLEAQSLAATAAMAQQRIELAQQEIASRSEYASLVKQYTQEEQAADLALLDTYEMMNEEMTRLDTQRLAALEARTAAAVRAAEAEKAAMAGSLPFLSNYGEGEGGGGSRGGGGGYGGIGLRMGTSGVNPVFRITESIGAALGPLMDIIFPIALITLGIDLWERFHESMVTMVNSLTGAIDVFDQLEQSAKKMYAAKEAEVDQNERIRTQARRLGMTPEALMRQIGGISTPGTRELDALKAPLISERQKLDSIVNTLRAVPPFARDTVIRAEGRKLGLTDSQDLTEKRLLDRQKETADKIEELTKHKIKIQTEEAESLDRNLRAHKKFHDAIHELPNRLPWFMSAAPYAFPGYGAFGAQSLGSSGSISSTFSRSAPKVSGFSGSSNPGRGISPTPISSGEGRGIVIQNNYTFAPHFEGVPADIQQFVRDKMEPMIIDDLDHNTRGFTAAVIDKLEKAGIRASK